MEQKQLTQKLFLQNWRKNINPTKSEGRYAGKDYRQLLIDNYIDIFRIDEQCKIVYEATYTIEDGIYKTSTK